MQTARQMIKFIKLIKADETYKFETIAPFWEDENWQSLWDERQRTKKPKAIKTDDWRAQFNDRLNAFKKLHTS